MRPLVDRLASVHSEQVVRLKAKHEGVLLMIEVGYKYKFFGEDAKVCMACITCCHALISVLRQPPRSSELLHTLTATLLWHPYQFTGVIFTLESNDLCYPHYSFF